MRERSRIGVLLLVLGSMTIRLCESSGFLQNELPLKVVVTTPVELIQAPAQDAVQLSGSQALTVSRNCDNSDWTSETRGTSDSDCIFVI